MGQLFRQDFAASESSCAAVAILKCRHEIRWHRRRARFDSVWAQPNVEPLLPFETNLALQAAHAPSQRASS